MAFMEKSLIVLKIIEVEYLPAACKRVAEAL